MFEESLLDVKQNNTAAKPNVHACLSAISADERPWVEGTLVSTGVTENVNCRHISDVCVAAHFIDFLETMWSEGASKAPDWHHQLVSIAQNWLSQQTMDAAPDSLLDVAEVRELEHAASPQPCSLCKFDLAT